MDLQGWAYVIAALAAAVPVVGGFVLQVLTYRRQAKRDEVTDQIKLQVDGLGEKREAMAMRAGTAEGTAAGIKSERADPQTSAKATNG